MPKYSKTNWIDGETILKAEHMQKIEQGIVDLCSEIENITLETTDLSNYYTKTQTDNKISEEIAKAQLGEGSGVSGTHKLYGLKWGAVGDSITQVTYAPGNAYHDVIAKYTGCINYNYGISATTVAIRDGRTDSMLERIDGLPDDLDIITVLGGTNDFGAAVPVPIGQIGNNDTSTFYGAYEAMILKLINKYPDKAIGLITPIQRGYTPGSGLDNYRQAILKLAEKYCIPVLDLWKESGLCCDVERINNLYFHVQDKLHPNIEGQKIIARPILNFLEKIYCNFDLSNVEPPAVVSVQSVELNNSTVDLEVGDTYNLSYTITPINATNKGVTWEVDNDNCTVQNGLVTAKKEGSSIITITTNDGNKMDTCRITISANAGDTSTSENLYNDDTTSNTNSLDVTTGEATGNTSGYFASDYIYIPQDKQAIFNKEECEAIKSSSYFVFNYGDDKVYKGSINGFGVAATVNGPVWVRINIHSSVREVLKITLK